MTHKRTDKYWQAYASGVRAYESGRHKDSNPYLEPEHCTSVEIDGQRFIPCDQLHPGWNDGWDYAQRKTRRMLEKKKLASRIFR
jgi:hypothetical protein